MESKSKPYSRQVLVEICKAVRARDGDEPRPEEVLRWHVLKDGDGGVWLAPPERLMTIGEREIMQWHPKKNGELPALPVPFDEYELAAFFLFGGGVFLREADPRLIGENAGTAREALIRARWWCRKALRRGFACNSKGMHEAANWILGQPRVVEPVLPSYEAPSDALATVPMVSVTIARMESKEDRQDRRLKACIDAGLVMPESAHGRLPYGVGKVAAAEGVTRQTFSDDVKAALKRHYARQREGVTHHRIK